MFYAVGPKSTDRLQHWSRYGQQRKSGTLGTAQYDSIVVSDAHRLTLKQFEADFGVSPDAKRARLLPRQGCPLLLVRLTHADQPGHVWSFWSSACDKHAEARVRALLLEEARLDDDFATTVEQPALRKITLPDIAGLSEMTSVTDVCRRLGIPDQVVPSDRAGVILLYPSAAAEDDGHIELSFDRLGHLVCVDGAKHCVG